MTLVEGWNFRQVRAALAKADELRPDTRRLTDAELMDAAGRPGVPPEGRFFPDTYTYSKGSSDVAVLQARHARDGQAAGRGLGRSARRTAAAKTPDEALILASIVEKETGKRRTARWSPAVFNNRLRIGMPLQTDPTVIYGLGDAFDGNLRKRDLQTDTPYNTYMRAGLPPTPIAMPGKASLLAAVQPAPSKALYFVAARRRHQPVQRDAGRAQPGRQQVPARAMSEQRPLPQLRRHRRRRQVHPHRGAGRGLPRARPRRGR